MRLDNQFVVPVPIERAWAALQDLEGIAPCLPGAQLESADGDTYAGTVKVKLGPVTVAYRGTVCFVSKDEDSRVAVLRATARETRGGGNVKADITASLTEGPPGSTTVIVDTDLAITGRPAQFGRGMLLDVSAKIFDQFADRLAHKLSADALAPAASQGFTAVTSNHPPQSGPDVLDVAGILPWRQFVTAGAAVLVVILAATAVTRAMRRPVSVRC